MDTPSTAPIDCSCPVCDTRLPFQPHGPPFEASCPQCGYSLWCSRRTEDKAVVLKVVPGMTPEHADVERLCEALAQGGRAPNLILDLSDIELIGSALTARLIALNKQIRAAGGRLVLCGLHRLVRDTFQGSRLDRVFEVADDAQAALENLG